MVTSSTFCFLLLPLALILAQSATAGPDNGPRADYPPYGIDYPTGRPTSRFSNGYNIPDLIIKLLVGANFASAGAGILNDTGTQFFNVIRMYKQLEYFEEYQRRVSDIVGLDAAKRLMNQALVLISVGGNDFVNNYYLVSYSARSGQYPDVGDYVKFLIPNYKKLLHKLYKLGARRVLVTGSGPMGCAPVERGKNGRCSADLQRAASLYNLQLDQLLKKLNSELGGDIFIAANINKIHNDYISNPQAYGFKTTKVACCGQGPYNGIGICTPLSNLFPDRNLYAFWDAFHPTDYMSPKNLSSILALDSMTN